MIITNQGANYFKLVSGSTTILIDPTDQRSFRGANVIVNTKRPAEVGAPPEEEVFWIDHAGEYEVQGTRIQGFQSSSDEIERTVYRIDFEKIRIVVLGDLKKPPKDEIQEHLTDVDIVITSSGEEKDSLKAAEVAKFIRQLEPGLIIPSASKGLKDFLKEFGKEKCKEEEKIVLRESDLKEGEMDVRCLKP